MSTALADEPDLFSPPARRPGTLTRFLLFVLAGAGTAVVLAVGFPPGAPDRLPVLLLALAFTLRAVFRPAAAIREFAFVFPVAGLLAAIFGASDPVAWPVLLFGGLAIGWSFRFLYDFESPPDRSALDGPLRGLAAIWTLATILAVARARTLWAALHGFRARTVNGEGLSETAAVRETVLALAVLGAGAAFFFLLRRAGAATRGEAMRAALAGTAVTAGVALLQALAILPADPRPFWKMTGRLSGGATDPNALGLICGLGIVAGLGAILSRERRRRAIWVLLPLPVGLAMSGSRSGFLVALAGAAAVLVVAPARRRLRIALAGGAIGVAALLVSLRGSPGDLGDRLGNLLAPALTLDDRASSRPILWRAAWRQFEESPLEGGGLGSFSWRLPDLAGADSARLPMRDNPGSAYLQALAETGPLGLLLMLAFVFAVARQAFARRSEMEVAGAAAAVLAFLLALAVGSHWLAPEVSLFFFLLCAVVARPAGALHRRTSRLGIAIVLLYALLVARASLATGDPAETFRHGKLIGFHDREVGPGGEFRWTRKRFATWVPGGAREAISLANYSPEGKPVAITVRADDGTILHRRTLAPAEAVTLALWAGARDRPFLFGLDRAFVPKRLGISGDRRELGLLAVLPQEGRH